MDVTVTSVNKPGYLLIISTGNVASTEELFGHSQLVYAEIIKHQQKRILLDNLGAKFPTQFYSYVELVDHYSIAFPPEIRTFKIAAVIVEEYMEFGKFWETIAVNRGFRYHAFTSFEDAQEWLLEGANSLTL